MQFIRKKKEDKLPMAAVEDAYEDEPSLAGSLAGTTASSHHERSFARGGSTRSSWNPDNLSTMRPVGVSTHDDDDDDDDADEDEEERANGLLLDQEGFSDRPPRRQLACVPFMQRHPWVMFVSLLAVGALLSTLIFRVSAPYDDYYDDEFSDNTDTMNAREDDSVCSRGQVFSSIRGRSECEAYCNDYMCCFQTDLEEDPCAIDTLECNAFRVCQVLVPLSEEDVAIGVLDDTNNSQDTNTNVENDLEVPQDQDSTIDVVEDACAPGRVTTKDGYHDCERHCEAYMCCFEEDDNCVDEKGPNGCANYKDCSILLNLRPEDLEEDPNTGGTVVDEGVTNNGDGGNEDDVDDGSDPTFACDPESVVTPDGRQRCADHCSNIMCCFLEENDADNCREEMGDTMCDIYKECTILLNFNDDVDVVGEDSNTDNGANTNDDTSDVCAPDQVQRRETRGPCNEFCEAYMCCFEEDDNCVDEKGQEACDAHAKCAILVALGNGLELDSANNNGDDTNTNTVGDGGGGNDNAPKLRRLKATSSTHSYTK